MKIIGDLIGLLTVLIPVGLCAAFVPWSPVTAPSWLAVYAVIAFISIFFWRSKAVPDRPSGWVGLMGIILLIDTISFLGDVVVGFVFHPQTRHSIVAMVESAGGPFGFGLTVLIIPAVFIAAFGGLFRSMFLAWHGQVHA